jgi:thiol-disulfide isomerase/thioredoxin
MKIVNDFLKLFKGKDAPMNVLVLVAAAVVGVFLCKLLSNVMRENFENGKALTYYHMDGCGHCKKFDPIWDKFMTVKPDDVQCNKVEAKDKPADVEVAGYPTIMLTNNGQKVAELEERTVDGLKALCNKI